MRVSRWSMIALCLAFLVTAGSTGCAKQPAGTSTTSPQSADEPTIVSVVTGEVWIMKASTTTWSKVAAGMTLEPGDRIRTGDASNAVITFFEGSTIELAANTEISVNELGIVKETGSTIIKLWQQIGKTRSRVEKLIDPASRYEIETPAGAAVVRGSVADVKVLKDGTTIIANIEGRWWAIAQGKEVPIPQAHQVTIIPGQAPGIPVPIPPPPVLPPPPPPPPPARSQRPPTSVPAMVLRPQVWVQTTVSDFSSGTSENVTVIDVGHGDGTVVLAERDKGIYHLSGTLESSSHDCRRPARFGTISWDNQSPGYTEVKFQIATNNNNLTWYFLGPDGSPETYYTSSGTEIWSGHDGHRYIKYKAYLQTCDPYQTPELKEVRITYR